MFCLLTELSWSYSRKFSHHNNGYKMCLNVCAGGEGDDEGTHLSIFLYLMKGPHDDNLKWPLRVNTLASLVVKLLNQISDNLHYTYPKGLIYEDSRVTEDNMAIARLFYVNMIGLYMSLQGHFIPSVFRK